MTRPRNRTSAKAAGARFNREIADHLARHIDDRIDVRHPNGAKDRGDIAALRSAHGHRIVVECKNERGVKLGTWYGEATIERLNDDAAVAIVAHKRHNVSEPGLQWITMTVDDLITLITGQRP